MIMFIEFIQAAYLFDQILDSPMSNETCDHVGQNGHDSKCYCDLCDYTEKIGFYTCTCNQCDPEAKSEANEEHETRHDAICGCPLGPVQCEKYPHVNPEIASLGESRCDCRVCRYDPILACDDGCPVCAYDLFVDHMRERYESSLSQDEQPAMLGVHDTKLFKYEIQQWRKPAGIWVTEMPKVTPFEPVIEYACLDIDDAKKCIQNLIEDSKCAHAIQPPKIIKTPANDESKTPIQPDWDKIMPAALSSWHFLKSKDASFVDWPVFWEDYKTVYLGFM